MKVEWALSIQPHHKDPHRTDLLRKSQFSVGDAEDSIRQASVHTISLHSPLSHLHTNLPAANIPIHLLRQGVSLLTTL